MVYYVPILNKLFMKTPVSNETIQKITKFFTYYSIEEACAEIEICMAETDDSEQLHLHRMIKELIQNCHELNCEIQDNDIDLKT